MSTQIFGHLVGTGLGVQIDLISVASCRPLSSTNSSYPQDAFQSNLKIKPSHNRRVQNIRAKIWFDFLLLSDMTRWVVTNCECSRLYFTKWYPRPNRLYPNYRMMARVHPRILAVETWRPNQRKTRWPLCLLRLEEFLAVTNSLTAPLPTLTQSSQ